LASFLDIIIFIEKKVNIQSYSWCIFWYHYFSWCHWYH